MLDSEEKPTKDIFRNMLSLNLRDKDAIENAETYKKGCQIIYDG